MRDEPLLPREDVREVDRRLIAAGVPGALLMENAGRGAFERVALALGPSLRGAAVLVGPGNNGGDALVVARHLRARYPDAALRVACVAPTDALRGDAAVMRDALRACEVEIELARDDGAWIAALLDGAELVVDGLFGTGLTRPLEGVSRALVRAVNARSFRCVAALDLPSGLDADTGGALGEEADVLRATLTCTFAAGKPGLYTGLGLRVCGEVTVVGLGAPLPPIAARAWRSTHTAPPPRAADAHKGDAGHVVVIAGSAGKVGAALLAARGAHRGGAGLVTIASRAAQELDARVLETMTRRIPEDLDAVDVAVGVAVSRASAVVLGPGLGLDDVARETVRATLARCEAPLVIDADALSLAAPILASQRAAVTVLTPHPLEMARLLGVTGERPGATINADRYGAAREAARRFRAVVVLKGAGTVVAHPDGRAWVLPYADPTLGVAGSGDVLAGALGARLAEEHDPVRAVLDAAHAHGRAGAAVRARRGAARGALASELADALSACLEDSPP